jgi:PAS domain S-box-containing protein
MGATTGSIRVLHVDDEPAFASMAGEYLERNSDSIQVEAVESPDAALDRLGEGDVDCVVSDYEMPGTDGIELLEAVREEYPELPFILYTGKGSEEVASKAISAGVNDYLQKASGTSQYELLANRVENLVEQYRAREAAAETERQLRTIACNTENVLWQFSADWEELLFVNDSYEEIWGRSATELRERPRSFLEGVHPDDRERVEAAMAVLSDGESVDIGFRVDGGDAGHRWVRAEGHPVREDGEVTKVVGYARDVTERKEREHQLQTAYESHESLIEASPVPIWVQKMEEILYANEAAAELHGVTDAEALVGRSALAFVPENEREHALRRNEQMLEDSEPVDQAVGVVVTDDGERRQAVFSGAPITYYGERAIVAIARELPDERG